ncbi:MAG: hypothetical protein DRO36_01205 [Candidatus Hecatellales archaeon]|nr:MAG: hypothetical protein DRO36_01205 [Candidatus Hecatellales archaeon]
MKVLALISGGIDSPVAAYMVGRMNVKVIPIYFDNSPFSSGEAKNRAVECIGRLSKILGLKEAYIFPYGVCLQELSNRCKRNLICVLCRRMMFRVAERFALEVEASALVTGESLGQVASQTLQNVFVEDKAVKIPILRPLIGLNKEESVKIARRIGTYEISTRNVVSCTVNPKHPATKAKLSQILEEEKKLNIEKLVFDVVSGRKKVFLG